MPTIPETAAVLGVWQILELLSYTKIDEQLREPGKRLFAQRPEPLAWERIVTELNAARRSPFTKEPRAFVYLGVFNVSPVLRAACEALDVPRSSVENIDERSAIAALRLTRDGRYAEKSLTLGALPWTVGRLARNPRNIDRQAFGNLAREAQADGELWLTDRGLLERPVEHADLTAFETFLRESAGCASVNPNEIARVLVRPGEPNDKYADYDDDDLLNSFFLSDLETAAYEHEEGCLPPLLSTFLGEINEENRRDHGTHRYETSDALRPEHWARGAWPNRHYDPILMQEAAVSVAHAPFTGEDGERITAVNGPPGTGKTTLLRSFIADRLVERAHALTRYDNPRSAFTLVDQGRYETYSSKVFAPATDICGYEMVIATMSNKAAENISDELPAKDSVDGYLADLEELDHYSAVACAVAESRVKEHRKAEAPPSWGLMAASLGAKKKRDDFVKAFWWNPERTLRAAVDAEIASKKTLDWKQTRARFQEKYQLLEERLEARGRIAAAISLNRAHVERCADAERELREAQERLASAERAGVGSRLEAALAHDAYDRARTRFLEKFFKALRPALTFLFQRAPFVEKGLATLSLKERAPEYHALHERATLAHDRSRTHEKACDDARTQRDRAEERLRDARRELEARWAIITAAAENEGIALDPTWWSRPHGEIQEDVPLLDDDILKMRRGLFIEALAVHRAFMQAAWDHLKPTLAAWVNMLGGRSRYSSPATFAAMWRAAFLVVPVISTTFASVGRMLRDVPPETFAWAIVDEAGQALPQAAVGLFRRSQRALVVGDPSQILPVVPLGERFVRELRERCGVHADWVADGEDGGSLQTLADRASRHGAVRASSGDKQWIGIPLYVHRRCIDPMFTVSNTVAYDGAMINRTKAVAGDLALPPSRWIDLNGVCDDGHVVRRQITYVGEAIRAIREHAMTMPSIYVITPFRDIAKAAHAELAKAGLTQDDVGTVHTFQGKQADIVFMILGLDEKCAGAAGFATRRPNLLNVAITRAKHRCYIVGAAAIWGAGGYFGYAREMLGTSGAEAFLAEMRAAGARPELPLEGKTLLPTGTLPVSRAT